MAGDPILEPFQTANLAPYIDVLNKHAANLAATRHPQEHDMTSPTQRRHDEIIGRLDALIDAVKPGDKQPAPEPVDVTEEPPIGSQVTDKDGDVWYLHDGGWTLIDANTGKPMTPPGRRTPHDWRWVREFAPLRLTTDADRERVGLPLAAPCGHAPDKDEDRVQVKDEPPYVGAQVTNAKGVIAERFEGGWRWRLRMSEGWQWSSDFHWAVIAGYYSPLYLPTDEERRKADLPVKGVDSDDTEAYLTGKRAPDQAEQLAARVLDLEADVERLTRERDEAQMERSDALRERDEWREVAKEAGSRANSEATHRAAADARYKALREDVTAHALHHAHDQSGLAFDCFATTLEDDDKRGRDA